MGNIWLQRSCSLLYSVQIYDDIYIVMLRSIHMLNMQIESIFLRPNDTHRERSRNKGNKCITVLRELENVSMYPW